MNQNQMNVGNSDSKFEIQYCLSTNHDSNQAYQDNDSDSSILNLMDIESSLDKTPDEVLSPYFAMVEPNNSQERRSHTKRSAIYDVKSDVINPQFEDLVLSKLPQVITIDKPSILYQIFDLNYPSLTNSFKHCFISPVANLLVVVFNTEKLVSFYQGYFAGIPRLANELINLNGKYWKSLISNNDENVWDHHDRSVNEKFNSLDPSEPEFEIGPVIRCRLKASSNNNFQQQFNYFFVQPCSYMISLPGSGFPGQGYNRDYIDGQSSNTYMVSYINVMRVCDTEFALKGSAAATFQKLIATSSNIHNDTSNNVNGSSLLKPLNNRPMKPAVEASGQLTVNISPPMYPTSNKHSSSAPLTYPMINEQQYSKSRPQIQPNPMANNQYMTRCATMNIIDQNQQQFETHYQVHQPTSTLQYILENRNLQNPSNNSQPINSNPSHMMPQNGPVYQNLCRPSNLQCYLPIDHSQSTQSNCSLTSPTSFAQIRHLVSMSSSGIILSPEQYFRNSHQMNLVDQTQVVQPMMSMVRSMPSTQNQNVTSYYCSTTPSQTQPLPSLHCMNSLTYHNQFSIPSLPQYCSNGNDLNSNAIQSHQGNRLLNPLVIKKESDVITSSQRNWNASQITDNGVVSTYCDTMDDVSMPLEDVEEILKAEEEKTDNKPQTQSLANSDNSDQLSFDMDDFKLLGQVKSSQTTDGTATKLLVNCPQASLPETNKVANSKISQELSSNNLWNLKSETLEKFTTAQKMALRNFVEQQKAGKLTKKQMLLQINDFVAQTLGKKSHYKNVVEFWKTQHSNIDSTNLNCSHIVQSPEEGPGISPTEQAAQSTTDMEEDKDMSKHISRLSSKKFKSDSIAELSRQRSRSSGKGVDPSIYSITSTTPTGVLETLLNEHDHYPHVSDKGYNPKLSVSSSLKNQLSLDQLLMDDDCSMFAGFNSAGQEEKHYQKVSDSMMRQLSSNSKAQATTTNMGVLESLLNQKNPSLYRIRQKSTESILNHSKPSRQNSFDTFHEEMNNATECNDQNHGSKNNSLLITLLNTSNSNSSTLDKYSNINPSVPCSVSAGYCFSQAKRQRTAPEIHSQRNENGPTASQNFEKTGSSGQDVFDFAENEMNYKSSDFQSCAVSSCPSISNQRSPQPQRNRKRGYSRDLSGDSDGSSDKAPSKSTPYSDKKIVLTSLLDNGQLESATKPTLPFHQSQSITDTRTGTDDVFYDNMDLDDIKIDDLDLEHLIDAPEPLGDSNPDEQKKSRSPLMSLSADLATNMPGYSTTMVTPVVTTNKSDPIIPISKPSVIRVSDKNSILFSAIQSNSSTSIVTTESLDIERERLLKQQQQQKVCMGGKYVSLNQVGTADVDCQSIKINHTLSLDLLSKQMKEVVPNVMVEQSGDGGQSAKLRRASYPHVAATISPSNPAIFAMSPVGRLSSSDIQVDNGRTFATTLSQANHQQVKEGLRQLVSNRSAQNNSKSYTPTNQTFYGSSVNELMSPGTDANNSRTPGGKSIIHYHSDSQTSSNQSIDASTTAFTLSTKNPPNPSSNGLKTTNILEDSLVNDVFELEELVKCNTSKPDSESDTHQMNHVPRHSSEQCTSQRQPMSVEPHMTLLTETMGQPHHHHQLQHYNHYYPPTHHHHHLVHVAHTNNEPSTPVTIDNQSGNSNTGLLETLLSR